MKTIITATAALALLGACATTPPPICDRGAQVWTKYGTQEDTCAEPALVAPIMTEVPTGGSNSPTESVEVPEPTYPTPETPETHSEPVRGNPGNDKNVGRAGEQDKDEGSSGGTKGASTGKNKGEDK